MTDRQKFWLKVVLAVTFPVWIGPACVAFLVYAIALMIWDTVRDIVEPRRSSGRGGGR